MGNYKMARVKFYLHSTHYREKLRPVLKKKFMVVNGIPFYSGSRAEVYRDRTKNLVIGYDGKNVVQMESSNIKIIRDTKSKLEQLSEIKLVEIKI